MSFDIKRWKKIYLSENKELTELDFDSQEDFAKYKANLKTKMRDTTKVTIGGNETTAGDADPEKKTEKPKDKEPKDKEPEEKESGPEKAIDFDDDEDVAMEYEDSIAASGDFESVTFEDFDMKGNPIYVAEDEDGNEIEVTVDPKTGEVWDYNENAPNGFYTKKGGEQQYSYGNANESKTSTKETIMENGKFNIRTWRKVLNESIDQPQRMTEEEKQQTLEAVARFNEYTQHVYKTNEIKDMVENIRTLAENASKMAIEETADWFDVVSVKRDTKAIGESVKIFEATAKEIGTLQQRMESVFEDIGGKLGKYYEIKELVEGEDETMDESEAQDKYQAFFKSVLKKFGVESPADLSDEKKKEFFNYIDKNHKGVNEGLKGYFDSSRGPKDDELYDDYGYNFAKAESDGYKWMGDDKLDTYYELVDYADDSTGVKNLFKFLKPFKSKLSKYGIKNDKDLLNYTYYMAATMHPIQESKKKFTNKFQKQVNEAFEGLRNVISAPGYAINTSRKSNTINEGFGTWTVIFDRAIVSGVKYDGKQKYTVTARTTIEAIKKAVKQAGGKDSDWMAVDVLSIDKNK